MAKYVRPQHVFAALVENMEFTDEIVGICTNCVRTGRGAESYFYIYQDEDETIYECECCGWKQGTLPKSH